MYDQDLYLLDAISVTESVIMLSKLDATGVSRLDPATRKFQKTIRKRAEEEVGL